MATTIAQRPPYRGNNNNGRRGPFAAAIATPLYVQCELSRNIILRISEVGDGISTILLNKLRTNFEGKCCEDGIIKVGSSKILNYSAPRMDSKGLVHVVVVFDCLVCNPAAGAVLQCTVTHINKAGITAKSATEDPSPIWVCISREFNVGTNMDYNIGDPIQVDVVNQRYELNDPVLYIIGQIHRG